MLALEFATHGGEGDRRCTVDGIPGETGFLRVADNQGADVVFIEVSNTAPSNPVVLLRQAFDAWREKNSCDQDSRLVQAADKSSNEAKSPDGASRNPGLNEGAMPQTAFGSEQNRGAAFDGTSMDETGAPHSDLEREEKSQRRGCASATGAQSHGWIIVLLIYLPLMARYRRHHD